MKLSKKYRKKLKNRILMSLSSIAIVTTTLATIKLADISMPKNLEIKLNPINVFAEADNLSQDISQDDTSSACLKGIKINGKKYDFEEDKNIYNIDLEYDTQEMLEIEYLKINENQTINGESEYVLLENNKTLNFEVISEDKTNKKQYTLNLSREHSTYLKNIEINSFALIPEFDAKTTEYEVNILADVTNLNVYAVAYDKESIITIQGEKNVSVDSAITITITNPHILESRVYTITCKEAVSENDYNYSGGYQEFVVPYTGTYKFECWGARGGKSRINGKLGGSPGKGGYAKGEIALVKGEKYYVYVGQQGTDAVVGKNSAATWNGGGLGTWDARDDETSGAGGGATDIRLVSGNWSDTKSLASRIIVAGGGGGASWTYVAGNGGGLSGGNGGSAKGGTQISGYSFGIGQNASGIADDDGVGGGRRWLLGWIYGK